MVVFNSKFKQVFIGTLDKNVISSKQPFLLALSGLHARFVLRVHFHTFMNTLSYHSRDNMAILHIRA